MWFSTLLVAASLTVPANIGHLQETQVSAKDTEQVSAFDDEILISGDPMLKKLKGTLGNAYRAFLEGQFDKAEHQFSRLAHQQLTSSMSQQFNWNEYSDTIGRSISTNSFEIEDLPTLSAPNATARSPFYSVSGARLRASASKLYYLKGLAQVKQGKTEKAKKSFIKAIRLYRNNVDARTDLTIIALQNDEDDLAERQMARMEKIFSNRGCSQEKCYYSSESWTRYSQLKQYYQTNITLTN